MRKAYKWVRACQSGKVTSRDFGASSESEARQLTPALAPLALTTRDCLLAPDYCDRLHSLSTEIRTSHCCHCNMDDIEIDEVPTDIDPYQILSLDKEATEDEVKKAYRKAALKWHPGTNSFSSHLLRDHY